MGSDPTDTSNPDVDAPDEPEQEKKKLSAPEDFDRILSVTQGLVESHALWWKLSAHALVTPRLDEDAVTTAVGAKRTKTRKTFERILSREIVPALNEAAGGLSFSIRPPGDLSAEEKKEFKARSKRVEKALYSTALRERVLIKRTCKGPSLEELRWDISIKKHDLNLGSVADIPYATVEMVLVPEVGETGPFTALGLGSPREVFAFDCHLQDLEAILRDLSDLKRNLEKLTQDRK